MAYYCSIRTTYSCSCRVRNPKARARDKHWGLRHGRYASGPHDPRAHRQAASHLGVRVFAIVQARIPEDNAGCGRVVEAAGGRRAGAATGRGGRGRLAEEIGDAPHDVHRLRPRPSRASSSPASPIAEEKNLGDPNRTRDAHSDLRELRGTRSRSRRGDSRGGIGNSVWDRRARATSPMFRARNVGRSVRFVRGEEEV